MKNVEERLRNLPTIAQCCGVEADEALKKKILYAAEKKEKPVRGQKPSWVRAVPAFVCAVAVLIGAALGLPALRGKENKEPVLTSQAAGQNGDGVELPEGALGKALLDVPMGSISVATPAVPDYRNIWAGNGTANFPLVCVNGRYYRMLTTPQNLSDGLRGDSLGTVDTRTDEPALAGKDGVISNVVAENETVYAVSGMNGAMVTAAVDGKNRVFQRVSFGEAATTGGESLSDTLRADKVTGLKLSGVGTVEDADTARALMKTLCDNASYDRAGGGETSQSLLIQLSNGLTMQLAVSGDKVIGCGTWVCPEFFEAFRQAVGN